MPAKTYLMCPPEHFTVSYAINPWMTTGEPVDHARASQQWQALRDTYLSLGHQVCTIDPVPGLPQATGLAAQLAAAGFEPVPVDLSEFRKAGGGPKCCTLELRPGKGGIPRDLG